MNGLDWAIIIVIALSVLAAAAQGFFYELFALAGTVLGFLLAAWEYYRVAPYFLPHVRSQEVANSAGFITIFFGVLIIAGIAGRVARWSMKEVGLRWFDRLLGAAFGLVRGGLVVTVAVFGLATFMPESPMLQRSELGRYFLMTAKGASWLAPADIKAKFYAGMTELRNKRMEALQKKK